MSPVNVSLMALLKFVTTSDLVFQGIELVYCPEVGGRVDIKILEIFGSYLYLLCVR